MSGLPRELRDLIASGPMAHLSTTRRPHRRRRSLGVDLAPSRGQRLGEHEGLPGSEFREGVDASALAARR